MNLCDGMNDQRGMSGVWGCDERGNVRDKLCDGMKAFQSYSRCLLMLAAGKLAHSSASAAVKKKSRPRVPKNATVRHTLQPPPTPPHPLQIYTAPHFKLKLQSPCFPTDGAHLCGWLHVSIVDDDDAVYVAPKKSRQTAVDEGKWLCDVAIHLKPHRRCRIHCVV